MTCLLCQSWLPKKLEILDVLGLKKESNRQICLNCEKSFAKIIVCCTGCGRQQESDKLCYDCCRWQRQKHYLLHHRALFEYNNSMKAYMQRYKFNGEYDLRRVFNQQLINIVQNRDIDIVVPIPVSDYTYQTRGFNQTLGLFEGLSYRMAVQVRSKYKAHQSQFSRSDRMVRTQPFVITDRKAVLNQRVLLIDDVYTTGNTLYHAADLCYEFGAKNVTSVSLAR